jgi:Tol biopolymer transport system component
MSFSFDSRFVTGARLFFITALALLALATPAHSTFPGANGKIAFSCGDGICIVNADGTGQTKITQNPYTFRRCTQDFGCFEVRGGDYSPSWSADGRKVLFARETPERCCEIFSVSADGAGLTDMNAKTFGPHDGPTWSPDGTRFAFVSDSDPSKPSQLWVKSVDGTSANVVAEHAKSPNWSPDGRMIVYGVPHPPGALPGTQFYLDLHVVAPDGSGERQITSSPDSDCGRGYDDVSWSPDGVRLAVATANACTGYRYHWDLGVLNADGTGLVIVRPTNGTRDNAEPAWSPDGTKIAFETEGLIRVMNADGTDVTNIVPGSQPDWQPIVNRPPDCSDVTATPDTLWPPNRRLVPVSFTGATDPDGDQVTVTITGVTQDEPAGGMAGATLGPAANQASLRAERDGAGDGRVYRVAFKGTDGRGGECSGTAIVGVPHNRGSGAVDSAPPSYDSLGH